MRRPQLVIERVGPLALIEDVGRPGQAAAGVSPSGAADRASYDLGNRIVGNDHGAASLELLLGGLALRPSRDVVVAVTGAPAPVAVAGRAVPLCTPVVVPAGQPLRIGSATAGLRTYLAVAGGIDVPPVLGSRSADPTSAIGPAPLRPGDRLPVGRPSGPPGAAGGVPISPPIGPVELSALLGPRDTWLTDAALARLGRATWTVGAQTDRVGVRLDGPTLDRARTDELASEGVLRGAVQVPPDGQPVIFLADHPVTGGYPAVAVIDDAALDRLAQLRPGEQVRFTLRRPGW